MLESEIEVQVEAHAGRQGRCSQCRKPSPGYDRLDERRWEFVPLDLKACSTAIPEKKLAVVALSNGENENASVEYIALARKIYDLVTPH